MATTRQLLRILRLSLLLNLIHISISLQINFLHQSHPKVLSSGDVGFFHPDISDVHGPGPVVTVGSDMVYRDIYTWVEILNELAKVHGTKDVTQLIQPCLRGSAAIWWIVELTSEERKKLRKANLQRWSSVLIQRFKLPPSVARFKLTSSLYTTQDLDQPPRIWIHQMVQYAKAADIDSTFSQFLWIWSGFDANLRIDIPKPTPTTRLIDFLEMVDDIYPIWVARNQVLYGEYRHNISQDDPQLYSVYKGPFSESVDVVATAVRRQADSIRQVLQRVL